ncbi:MAG: nuclear transport factor 2 family protein [Thermoleophilaceae bacterium]
MRAGLTEWLDDYGRAWQERDPEAAADLFSEDAVYQWGPFGKRLRGRPLIRSAWADAVETQQNVEFGYEVLTASARSGLVRWWSAYDRAGSDLRIRLEGIFRLAFDEDGLCRSLEEWFNYEEGPLDGAPPANV